MSLERWNGVGVSNYAHLAGRTLRFVDFLHQQAKSIPIRVSHSPPSFGSPPQRIPATDNNRPPHILLIIVRGKLMLLYDNG
jgi:hypothetical protein